jgi:hypothetical protein
MYKDGRLRAHNNVRFIENWAGDSGGAVNPVTTTTTILYYFILFPEEVWVHYYLFVLRLLTDHDV